MSSDQYAQDELAGAVLDGRADTWLHITYHPTGAVASVEMRLPSELPTSELIVLLVRLGVAVDFGAEEQPERASYEQGTQTWITPYGGTITTTNGDIPHL